MAKAKGKPAGDLPTPEELLRFIEDASHPVDKRDIARAYNLKGQQRAELRDMLRELETAGQIERGEKRQYRPVGALPEITVLEVADREEFADAVAAAREEGIAVMAQKRVDIATGRDHSLASYVPPSGVEDALGVVGNAAVRYPQQFGTSCLVETADEPEIEARALAVLDNAGYHGISEAEFVYDDERGEFLLLDVNTRPWKWIGMPVAAGANLPMAAYAAVTDAEYESPGIEPTRWVYLRDYLALLAGDDAFWDQLSADDWRRLVSGDFERGGNLTTGVYRPSDPAPAAKLFETEFVDRDYYCAC